jgi:hypothetical protein
MLAKIFEEYGPGAFAPSGTYLNRKTWGLVQIPEGGGYLSPGEGVTYYRLPLLVVLVLGPLVGLAFILFLPLAVPIVALYLAAKVIARNFPWRARKQAGEGFPSGR